jgi:hypothetical protein
MKNNRFAAIFSIIAILLLAGASFAAQTMLNPLQWQERVKNGLIKVATYKMHNPWMTQQEAQRWLLNPYWGGIRVSCTTPTEQMWLQYCQNLYMENMAIDCNAVSPTDKQMVMNNMRICVVR